MNASNQPQREKEIFEQAVEMSSAEAQLAFVKGACGRDAGLLARVETLLRAHEQGQNLLGDAPGRNLGTVLASSPNEESLGASIGRYKLLQKIGEGGCGVVYMAEQEKPVRRRVALKVIKLGMDTKAVIARFEAERQALAMMDHPNIAKVFDAGTTDAGRPFFVMELVRGIPITKYCDEANLPTAARLELFTQVCHAIQHAHQKGIIHRDIKPSNILVTLHDGAPVPKVIDFGIAKATQGRLTDQTLFTAFEQFIGTPTYMSPEQAELSGLDIDTRSDIYSLGVLLYELLTGQPPFDQKTFMQAGLDEMRRIIREVEPPRPSARLSTLTSADRSTIAKLRGILPAQLSTLLSGDLDWIVMKSLEKNRVRRYESASALAADIQRHLHDEPVDARPPSTAYRLGKAIRRNKVAFGTGAAVAVSLALGIIVATTAYLKERTAHEFAVQAAAELNRSRDWRVNPQIEIQRLSNTSQANEKKAKIEAARNAYTLPLLKETFKGLGTGALSVTGRTQLLQTLDQTADRLNRDSVLSPEAKDDLLDALGDAYMELGEFVRAEPIYRQLLAWRRKMPDAGLDGTGLMRPDTAAALDKLIETLKRQGKSAEAEAELRNFKSAQSRFLNSGWGGATTSITSALNCTIKVSTKKLKSPWSTLRKFSRMRNGLDLGLPSWIPSSCMSDSKLRLPRFSGHRHPLPE